MDTFLIFLIIVIIFFAISELFGRAKHIGRWWTFFLLVGGFFPGVVALACSPNAKKKPTKGGKKYKIWAFICMILGIISLTQFFASEGKFGYPFLAMFILAIYLFQLSNGDIINLNPKFYLGNISPSSHTIRSHNVETEKINNNNNWSTAKQKLDELQKSRLISKEEYLIKIDQINLQIVEESFQNTDEYKNLKYLLDSNILSKTEFNEKLNILKSNIINQKSSENSGKNLVFRIIDGFRENLGVAIEENLFYGFVDKNNNIAIPFTYDYAENFSNGFAVVIINGKYGFIDKKNKVVIKPIFDYAETFSSNKTKVKIKNSEFYIDFDGNKI